MTERQITLIITIIGSLVSVSIGALLSPIVSSRIEKIKAKRTLKPALIKSIYLLFNYNKTRVHSTNLRDYNDAGGNYCWKALQDLPTESPLRPDQERQFEYFTKEVNKEDDKLEINFNKLVDIEAEILTTLSLIQIYYSEKVYTRLHNIIMPHIHDSNTISVAFFNYREMSHDVYFKLGPEVTKKVMDTCDALTIECDKLINKMSVVF